HSYLDNYAVQHPSTVQREGEEGVEHVVLIGQWREPGELKPGSRGGMSGAREALELARTDRAFFSATAGIHPHDAARATPEDLRDLESICREPDCVAVGE